MIKVSSKQQQIVDLIKQEPGIKFREIMKKARMANGSVSYLTRKLEQNGIIKVKRKPGNTIFYPNEIPENELVILSALRKNTTRKIIQALLLKEPRGLDEIAKEISKAASTTSIYLTQLQNDGIVLSTLNYRRKKFLLQKRELIDKLIESHHPRFWERPVEGFADMINSL